MGRPKKALPEEGKTETEEKEVPGSCKKPYSPSNKQSNTVMIETGAKQVETEEKKANSQIAAV